MLIRNSDTMSGSSFRLMSAVFTVFDFFFPYLDKRISTFGVKEGMVLVDYGCGPGRYTTRLARLVGPAGKVYGVDVQPLAIEAVRWKTERLGLSNVEPVLATGHDSGLASGIADMIFAIDMFFWVHEPSRFLDELRRLAKPTAVLIIDDGHQSRARTKEKLCAAGQWTIVEETGDHLKCRLASRVTP
jgi:ubiquinone/menaquinone biosynthesis C-methylase UbiE